ncbi:hypothetical protein C2W62_16155 [Candidatus Entotheonella serta]|nr:hypothetical protein C2W62_16155 [Candidatus Entotheonella serta]
MIIWIILANIRAGFICLRVLNLSVVIIPTHYLFVAVTRQKNYFKISMLYNPQTHLSRFDDGFRILVTAIVRFVATSLPLSI